MAFSQKNRNTVEKHIKNRVEFRHASMSGKWMSSTDFSWASYGVLPQETVSEMRELLKDRDLYVVYSYNTPIAYAWEKKFIIPDHKYSVTTSGHQSIVKLANL